MREDKEVRIEKAVEQADAAIVDAGRLLSVSEYIEYLDDLMVRIEAMKDAARSDLK